MEKNAAYWDEILEKTQYDTFWVSKDGHIVDRPELMYIHSKRDIQYLNTVLRVRGGEQELPVLIKEVENAHKGVRSRWLLSPNNQSQILENLLEEAGYTPGYTHHGYVMPVELYQSKTNPAYEARRVQTFQEIADFEEVTLSAFPHASKLSKEELERELLACTKKNARVIRHVVYDKETGKPISSGGLNIYPELEFGFLWAGATAPEYRGKRAYSTLMAQRFVFAKEMDLRALGLYAREGTSAPIVEAQGFLKCGKMLQWERAAT